MTERIQITKNVAISVSELSFRFSRSRGPGGQQLNKADTRVELLFDVARSPSLTEEQRQIILRRLANRIDSHGVLRVVSQETRSQQRNRERAIERFRTLLSQALTPRKKRVATTPSRSARERRLRQKKRRSEIKKLRRKPIVED